MQDRSEGLVVEREIHIAAPRERVWGLLSEREAIDSWLPMQQFEPRVGASFEGAHHDGTWIAFGEVTAFEPPRLVAFSWDWRNSPLGAETEVRFELEEVEGGTLVRLRHQGFVTAEQVENHTDGWNWYLVRLQARAEGRDPGPDTPEAAAAYSRRRRAEAARA